MTRRMKRTSRTATRRALNGERNTIRAEQLRACQCSRDRISAELGVDLDAIAAWFALQDTAALSDDNRHPAAAAADDEADGTR
jgi:hypothetical protein